MLSVQAAKISDQDSINDMMRRSLTHWGHDEDYINKFMKKLAVTTDYMRNQSVQLLYHHDQRCGFFCFKSHEGVTELDSLFLLPDYIGRGLGRLAWNLLCHHAKQKSIVEFQIFSQPGSEGFYLKMGCEKIGEQKSFIKEGMMIPILVFYLSCD